MADDIIQRMMDAEEDANLHQSVRDFSHTIQSKTDPLSRGGSLVEQGARGKIPTGEEVRAQLLQRAEEKNHLSDTLGEGSQFFDYKRSSVGGLAKDKEIQRQLTTLSRTERKKREARFGRHRKPGQTPGRKNNENDARRQAFNATGSPDQFNQAFEPGSHQNFNSSNPQDGHGLGITFREPPARGYDPFK